jgi:hypothetical protein
MNAIFKRENVYVVIAKDIRDDVSANDLEGLIWDYDQMDYNGELYGGRVSLAYIPGKRLECKISIDGITLQTFERYSNSEGMYENDFFSINQIAAFLNQIENLGVDTFLENYKLHLQELKKELEELAEKIQQEITTNNDDKQLSALKNIRKIITGLTCMIFVLLINMNAGLENHHYTEAYDTIINQYF